MLVGTPKGAFVLTADGKSEEWNVEGPHFGGWEIYHIKGSPADPGVHLYGPEKPVELQSARPRTENVPLDIGAALTVRIDRAKGSDHTPLLLLVAGRVPQACRSAMPSSGNGG